jgi:phosphoserine phosphatase
MLFYGIVLMLYNVAIKRRSIMANIYLLRHGETEWNREQRAQGCSNDIPLSEVGIKQAESVAKRLKNEKIDVVFSSPLKRAYQTAKMIANIHDKDVCINKEFLEINFGLWEGLNFQEIGERYPEIIKIWRATPHLAEIPNAESLISLKERSMKKLNEILKEHENKNIAIVSHGITCKVLISAIMGIDLCNLHKIRQDNTALNIFEYRNNNFYTLQLNDTCHLKEINE